MISPEPFFLDPCREFHYVPRLSFADAHDQCVELPKTPRQPVKSLRNGKKPESVKQEPLFDYSEEFIYDPALKTHLQGTYELFKMPFSGYRRRH